MAITLSEESKRFITAVSDDLSDLNAADREELLAEVEAALADLELDSASAIEERLGSPAAFAAELRAAAGFQPLADDASSFGKATVSNRTDWQKTVSELRTLLATSWLRDSVRQLAPIWWLVRGFLIVVGFAALFQLGFHRSWLDTPAGSMSHVQRITNAISTIAASEGKVGEFLLLLAIVVSISIGLIRRRYRSPGAGRILASSLVAILSFVAIGHIWHLYDHVALFVPRYSAYTPGLTYNGQQVDNVYPYSRDGRLLHDVLLYTGSGQPIEISDCPSPDQCSSEDPNRRVLRTKTGLVLNAFPIRYFDPGTHVVSHPNAAPPVQIPKIVTPPLRSPHQKH